MGRKGWAGAPPADDHEARKRIIDAAIASIERRGPQRTHACPILRPTSVSPARRSIVTSLSTEELLAAAVEVALDGWTARIGELTEGNATTRRICSSKRSPTWSSGYRQSRLLALLLETDRMRSVSRQHGDARMRWRDRESCWNTPISIGRHSVSAVSRMDDLVEFLLRMIQSMVIAPRSRPVAARSCAATCASGSHPSWRRRPSASRRIDH